MARNAGAKLVRAVVDAHGILHIRLTRRAHTILVAHIGPISDWAKAAAKSRSSTIN